MNLLALPVLIPLVSGALLLLLRRPVVRTVFSGVAASATLIVNASIAAQTLSGEVLTAQMADWPAPYGITLVADGLAGIMVFLSGLTGLLTVLFAGFSLQQPARRGQGPLLNRAREAFGSQALFQFLFMGVNMSFLTGDVFNLFVAFEVMLVASYGLLLIGGELPQLREGFKYVIVNLVASAVFVVAAGLSYGLFGTLNMADIAVRLSESGADPRVAIVAAMLALVFATKAALFPFGFWLPNAYPVPQAATSAFFAALLTKVGAYALIRCFTLMFPAEAELKTVILAFAGLTMLIGGLGAVSRRRWRHMLAFANVASIGYVVMGAFIGTAAGLSAALYYLVHSVLVVFVLFLLAAFAERIAGESYRAEGHLDVYPWLGAGFFLAALALAGIPPTSGFIGKFALISSLFESGGPLRLVVAGSAVLTSFLLLYACVKVWRDFFWGEADAVHRVTLPRSMSLITGLGVGLLITLALVSGPAYQVAEGVADQLTENRSYLERVLVDAPRVGGGD
jgi:multicomponent Na+:H+ antiporter subunit D